MNTQTSRILPISLLTAVAAYFATTTAMAQLPTLSTKDKVASRVGVFRGGSTYTLDQGGHTGAAGDRAVDFGMATGPVYVQDGSFLNALSASDEMTFAFWAKKYDIADGSAFWANSPSSNNGQRGFQAHVPWSNNNIYFDTAGCCDGTTQRINADIAGFSGYTGDTSWWTNWHFYVFSKKAEVKKIWIDGVLFLEGNSTAALPTDFTDLYIGSAGDGTGLFHALVDDFAVFGTALSETTIGQLYSGTLPTALPTSDKLAAYWDFNDVPSEGVFVSMSPVANTTEAVPDLIKIVHMDGTTAWASTNITLKVDGAVVTPTFVKDGTIATVSYVPSPLFTVQTKHTASITYPGAGGTPATIEWSFSVGAYTKDVVRSSVGVFTGGSTFTVDGGGHSGVAGDRAANFGSGTGPVNVKDASYLNLLTANDEMCFAFWMKKPSIEAGSAFWVNSPSSTSSQRGFQAHVPWSDSTIYFDTAGCCDAGLQRINANISTFAGYTGDATWWTNWHYFVFQKKLSTKEVWIDGQLFLTGDNTSPLPTDMTELFIGAGAPGVNLMSGVIDDFAIFGTALTEAKIQQLFGGTLPTAMPAGDKLTAYWNFNDFPSVGLFTAVIPTPNSTNARPDLIRVIHADGSIAWDASKVSLKVDDAAVTPTFLRNGTESRVSYVPSPYFVPGSTHKAALTYPLEGTTQGTLEWQFTVGTFPNIGQGLWTDQRSGFNSGFRIKTYHRDVNGTAIVNGWQPMLSMANQALAGYYLDNIADLTSFTNNAYYWEPGVINYSGSGNAGNFFDDLPFPGTPGLDGITGGDAMEVLTFLEFPESGFYTMGVNSDDGFRVTVGDRVGPDQTLVHVLKPDSLVGDKVSCQCENGAGTSFGGPVFRPPVVAQAVKADPILAGEPLVNAAAIAGKIAIVQRGTYGFNDKCVNCLNAGAIAVVMANINGEQPGLFGTTVGGVPIPCILINQADGDALLAAATTGADSPVVLRIGDDASMTLGEFITGRGSSDTTFSFTVPTAGLYPFRLLWNNGNGTIAAGNALNCEWFVYDASGNKRLINSSTSPVKAWIQRTFPTTGASLAVTKAGGVVTLSWTGEGELEEAYSVSGPWVKSANQNNPQTVSTTILSIGQTYYRIRSY